MRALVPLLTCAARERTIPLLALRVPEFAETAWRDGTRAARALERATSLAFRAGARRIVRDGDALVHDSGSDTFAIALLDRGREGAPPTTSDCRMALERLAASIATQSGRRMECGWWTIDHAESVQDVQRAIALALERGKRERERYEFLAAVGHELRTPLASIRGYLETVLDGDAGAPCARRFLETARRETLRLGRMVDGMLEFSLLDLSPPALSMERCDVRERISAAAETLAPLARSRRVTLHCVAAEPLAARINADACTHALLNLLDNALRYGRERGTVRISSQAAPETVAIVVDDDGIVRDGRIRGHGLGLTIARTIAERAGGAVTLSGSPLGGTRALLRLPRAR